MPEPLIQHSPVNIERLKGRMGKYALVVAVSKRARELKDRQSRLVEVNSANLVSRALQEIADGRVKLLKPEVEE